MKLLFTLLLSWLPLLVFSQVEYQRGYIITAKGDSLSGFIRTKSTVYNPEEIVFRKTQEERDVVRFKPEELGYVEITGYAFYEPYIGIITMDKTEFPDIPTGRDNTTATDTLLLEVLQRGPHVTLYAHLSPLKTRLFLKEGEGEVKELIYKQYYYKYRTDDNTAGSLPDVQKKIEKLEAYKNQLWQAAENAGVGTSNIKSRIESARYNVQDVLQVVGRINGLSKEELKREDKNQNNISFFTGVSISKNTLMYDGTHPLASNPQNKSNQLQPKVSVGADFYVNPKAKRFFIRGEIFATSLDATIESEVHSGVLSGKYYYSTNHLMLGLSPQLLYNLFRTPSLHFYAGTGIVANYHYIKQAHYERTVTGAKEPIQMNDGSTTNFSLGYPLRAGIIFKDKVEVSGVYVTAIGSTGLGYRVLINTLNAGINYHFAK